MFTSQTCCERLSGFSALGQGPGGSRTPAPLPGLPPFFLPVSCGPRVPPFPAGASFECPAALSPGSQTAGPAPGRVPPASLGSHPSRVRSKLLLRSWGGGSLPSHPTFVLRPSPEWLPRARPSDNLPLGLGFPPLLLHPRQDVPSAPWRPLLPDTGLGPAAPTLGPPCGQGGCGPGVRLRLCGRGLNGRRRRGKKQPLQVRGAGLRSRGTSRARQGGVCPPPGRQTLKRTEAQTGFRHVTIPAPSAHPP